MTLPVLLSSDSELKPTQGVESGLILTGGVSLWLRAARL